MECGWYSREESSPFVQHEALAASSQAALRGASEINPLMNCPWQG